MSVSWRELVVKHMNNGACNFQAAADELVMERDAEIERLRGEVKLMRQMDAPTLAAIEKRDAEIERLRGLVDACSVYLKEDETPAQRIERERADTEAVLKLLLKEKRYAERLRELLREYLASPLDRALDLDKRASEALGDAPDHRD